MPKAPRHVAYDEFAANLEGIFDRLMAEKESVVIERDGRDMAVLKPVQAVARRQKGRQPSAAEAERSKEGILKAAGSWKDIDSETFKEYIAERRRTSNRPRVRM